jgi:hypothetical protein
MKRGNRAVIAKSFITVLTLAWTFVSTAATVGVSFFGLSPNPVNIKEGDVVYWYDEDEDFGPYVISGAWGSFATPDGVQFNTTGTFNYTAQSAFGGGSWGGTVNVTTNSLPIVTIVTPTNTSVLSAPATFSFEAEAYDPDPNDIWDVEFWIDDVMIDDVFDPPYATTVTDLPAGTYTLKAIVWDFSFAKDTNSVTITVGSPGPIALTGAALVSGSFRFNASGLVPGKTHVLQSSTNPASALSWTSVSTNVAASSTASFTNAVAAGRRFFRLVELP